VLKIIGLSSIKQILKKSVKLGKYLTIINVILGVVVSKVYSNTLDLSQIMAIFGNFTLIEAMVLFLYGGAVDITGTAKWFSAMKILGIQKKEWQEGDSRSAENRALVYILCGIFLLIITIIFALLSS
jgi:hypothetical protein